MTCSIETPLSYVRSTTTESPPTDKRRRRPTFSLHVNINIARSFCATPSQSTTPALSPSQSCVLPLSPLENLPRTPATPTDTTDQWLNEDDRSLPENTPTFNFVAWANRDAPYFAMLDSPNSRIAHAPADNSTRSGNKDCNVVFENRQPTLTLQPFPQANFGGQNFISSVPQKGTDIEQGLSMRVKNDNSARVAARLPRPRSRPRDEFERVAPDHISPAAGELAGTAQLKANACPRFVVSANYRQLSAHELKELKFDAHRRYYKCLIKGCDRLFSRKSNVENHIRTHLDDKPFICSLSTCKSAFVRKGDLLRHEEIHRPSRAHICSW
ncbi:unnamed protein product [Rhizoctonia solani]|uniref:C2H2-type domain-containing protein n=1 Tax=Rhizoctonia solani TaxID=456999 RepID=A0A8H2WUJ7_9AGAM|nr:unnamed protein product [Rhizoctonia solani]